MDHIVRTILLHSAQMYCTPYVLAQNTKRSHLPRRCSSPPVPVVRLRRPVGALVLALLKARTYRPVRVFWHGPCQTLSLTPPADGAGRLDHPRQVRRGTDRGSALAPPRSTQDALRPLHATPRCAAPCGEPQANNQPNISLNGYGNLNCGCGALWPASKQPLCRG
jgi:hypothetical protein